MNQHPVPQNVTSYQFRLVGDMTLKQFGLLASGAVIGFIIYQLPVHPLIKWPFIFVSAFTGFALAFIPIEDRPLDRWLVAFLKSVYSPTWFYWKKTPLVPLYLQPSFKSFTPEPETTTPIKDRRQLTAYLQTLPPPPPPSPLDQQEHHFLDLISQLFQTIHPPTLSIRPLSDMPPEPPKLPPVRVRKLTGVNFPLKGEVRVDTSPSVARLSREGTVPKKEPLVEFKPLLFTKKDYADLPSASTPTSNGPTTTATTNPHLPFPTLPEKPNIIVGMVTDKYDRLLDNAIVEIRDHHHHPVRAVKTNKLGQFFTVTPLVDGKYQLVAEKDGYNFAILNLTLEGKVVNPVEIRALNEGPTPFK